MKFVATILFLMLQAQLHAQQVVLLDSGHNSSLRGLSVVTDKVIWACGSNGMVVRSTDGGMKWNWLTVAGHEKRDFRDVEAFDANTAIIMAVDTPALLLKTTDGGRSWNKVFEDNRPGMFLDAMMFWNELSGIVVGDPIDGKVFIARSFDGGNSWRGLPDAYYPTALPGEALFASSGTNISQFNRQEAVFVTGGSHARLFIRDKQIILPIVQGSTMAGANSIAVYDEKNMVIVGGNYENDTLSAGNFVRTSNRGNSFETAVAPPRGYRSCVVFLTKNQLVTCGTTGVDVSEDGGLHWRPVSNTGFHVVQKAKKGKAVFLAGRNGRIAQLKW